MIRANLETRHFTFDAYGNDEAEALAAMKRGWKTHRRQYGGPSRVQAFADFSDHICYYEIEIGKAYRDNEVLK